MADGLDQGRSVSRLGAVAAIDELIWYGQFENAFAVCELGCGTGRLANRLLVEILPPEVRYVGFDLSPIMVGLARSHVASFGRRADVSLTDGAPTIPLGDRSVDRFLVTYVFDLLDPIETAILLREAHRVLHSGGKLCLAGGCHPILLTPLLPAVEWQIEYRNVVVAYCTTSKVVIATPA